MVYLTYGNDSVQNALLIQETGGMLESLHNRVVTVLMRR
jgi:hypothetical protein